MRLKVFEVEDPPVQAPVVLKLRQVGTEVEVLVVDDKGQQMNKLLKFNQDGTISLAKFVNDMFGFKRDGMGCIILKGRY